MVPPSRAGAHAALERTLLLFGVAPPMLVFLPLYGSLWGASFALTHGLFMLLMGTLLVEFALRRSGAMPCAQPWDPQSLDLGRWWGAYLIGFILYTTKVPDIELSLRDSAAGIAAFSALAAGGIVTLRVHARRRRVAQTDTSAFAPGDVLSLN